MTESAKEKAGLVPIGQIRLLKNLVKEYGPPTRTQRQIIDAAVAIHEQPDAAERAFMARQLVQCTLPHTDPGNVEQWARCTGHIVLGITPGRDFEKNRSIGYPYGIIPRLLLFWVITEAVQTRTRRLVLGRSLAEFMRAVGLNPHRGGKRGDRKRLEQQMQRLFKCHISFQATANQPDTHGEAWLNMEVAPRGELWWHPHPNQTALWESWIELGEKFFEAVVASPVPLDMRALRALRRSPLALDLYSWASYRAFVIVQKNQPPQFVAWTVLMRQLGADYSDPKNFKRKAGAALRKIARLYPGLAIGKARGGFTIHAARLAVPQKTAGKLPA